MFLNVSCSAASDFIQKGHSHYSEIIERNNSISFAKASASSG